MNDPEKLQDLRIALLQKMKPVQINKAFCVQLSQAVFTGQSDYLSATTLMRLFGLLPMDQHSLNPKVIDMLNRYARTDEMVMQLV